MNIVAAQRITLAHRIKGGLEVQTDTLYRGLAARGHNVEIITAVHPNGLREVEEGRIRAHYLPHSDPRRYTAGWWRASYEKLQELVHRGRADVLLSQSAGAIPYVQRAQRELHLPAVIVIHTALGSGLYSQWRAATSLRGVLRFGFALAQAPLHWVLWRRAVAVADAVVTPSEEVAVDARTEFGAPLERITVIPNGVDVQRFAPMPEARMARRLELGLAPTAFVALAVTRLVPEKGVQVALRALAQVPEATLLVAGEGPYSQTLFRVAQQLDVAHRVRFLGFVARERLPEYMSAADVFVMPTLCKEGFPVSVVEAMACGVPPVASRIGGIPTAIDAERTGLLFSTGESDRLAQALLRLTRDEELRARLAAAARAEAVERFSIERMVGDMLAVLERVVAGRPRKVP